MKYYKIASYVFGIAVLPLCLLNAAAAQDYDYTEYGNYPCSQSKGETAYCQADVFVCNNGSISASVKDCRNDYKKTEHDRSLDKQAAFQPAAPGAACICRKGLYCLSKKGKASCLDDNGIKSALPKDYNAS